MFLLLQFSILFHSKQSPYDVAVTYKQCLLVSVLPKLQTVLLPITVEFGRIVARRPDGWGESGGNQYFQSSADWVHVL